MSNATFMQTYADLTAEERTALADIRRRKGELVDEIDAIRSELNKVSWLFARINQ